MKAISFAAVLLCRPWAATSLSADEEEGGDGDAKERKKKCSLYVAKSTIPNAGLGIFTGVPLDEDVWVGYGDPAIPIVDIDFHAGGSKSKEDYHWIIDEYVWRPKEVGPEMEAEAETTSAFVMGMGALPNCHLRLKNAGETHMTHDAAGINRTGPGTGAFTPYHNRSTYTLSAVAAGSELFVDYGSNWFTSREQDMGLVPLSASYPIANRFMKRAHMRVEKIIAASSSEDDEDSDDDSDEDSSDDRKFSEAMVEDAMSDLWNLVKESPYKSRPLSAIPSSFSVAKRAFEVGIQQIELEQSTRSLDYLERHGRCLDNIRSGNSSVPHAGRGAFATTRIERGGYITIAPLLHIPDRDILTMYADAIDPLTGKEVRDLSHPTGRQLLVNYCFGHRTSSLLLCPYGPGTAFINHNGQSPNAKIVWSSDPNYHNANWMNEPVSYFDNVWHGNLAFEYVATKDIDEGDEVFIDYGREWDEAWTEHVRRWRPPKGANNHVTARQLTQNPSMPVPTHEENGALIDKGMDVWCHFSSVSMELGKHEWKPLDMTGEEHAVRRIVNRTQVSPGGAYTYTLELGPDAYVVNNVSRRALSFDDKHYYTSDMFIKGAFRHEMMIPDEMFPDAWKNLV